MLEQTVHLPLTKTRQIDLSTLGQLFFKMRKRGIPKFTAREAHSRGKCNIPISMFIWFDNCRFQPNHNK